ncbi:MAG TPA: PQQ-binding-like beta-propeller repeat protein, partial [Pirellulales bacterium]|nr:PQQ-binding-like beta-propeller repeat protein [Pirellulales bacterium]
MRERSQLPMAALTAFILSLGALSCGEENWPQFRGPSGLGYTDENNLPLHWGGEQHENVLWQSPLIGEGHASPVVWGEKVFVCTALWPASTTDKAKVIPEHHVTCYAADDGRQLWDTQVPQGPWLRTDFRSGPGGGYAAPTPATDGELVFCAFGSAVIAALDFEGRIVWRRAIEPFTFDVTLGSSPVLFGDTVILFHAMANPSDSRVVAYSKDDGEVKWERKLPSVGFGHSTPVVIRAGGRTQLLLLAGGLGVVPDALQSLDPANGEPIWWCRGQGEAASPAYGAGIVYFDSGRGGTGTAVDPTGTGDVSQTHVKWTTGSLAEGIGSPIVVGEHVYRLFAPGILRCWQAGNCKQVYAQRLDALSTTWASPLADSAGHLFFANAGVSYVV